MREIQPGIVPDPQRQEEVLWQVDEAGIATLTLNRVAKHNAFDACMIDLLIHRLDYLALRNDVRCLVLRANGQHFSAGADLNWMQSMAGSSRKQNIGDATNLARLMQTLDTFPYPTLAVVQGSAFGGALGLICCCDIALASRNARFCLSEVRLGLVPATIGPYVIRAMGSRQARRYMLSAEPITAKRAEQLNLIHQIHGDDDLEQALSTQLEYLLQNSPDAQRKAKMLCHQCDHHPMDEQLIHYTSQLIAEVRTSPQGQEGLQAFLEKRTPDWASSGHKERQ
ncbi:enoyl-CoA hydratase-related protein [Vibrio sp. CAU 1672]|uniref:enoyl-CoA hydratase-related protein n=1 Tax=Vibrio sp. CAU 1672 TaxID=3032594 RepID=UPI0023DC1958|nr:enoyl-CoA hydratase-related protein [Vibrio sp. CAU 1672]MDF2155380.1 enoyl-CoA hydratase-related protein [Vibrio sp. CAU 1672]